ncbi:MAG: ribosomal protein S18-alanine N-acetyltransferase [Firmicutes bacterium]|nr:ribosomal protein S18-alanine N-acetyltransferase [Bacillota bacterium]
MIIPINEENLESFNQLLFLFHKRKITLEEISNNRFSHYFVYMKEQTVVAYIQYSIYYEKAELDDIFVLEEYRRMGIAKELLNCFINDCKLNQCENMTLEVREDNEEAISLYQAYGFQGVAKRKNYYQDCDAILMERKL